MNSTPVMSLKCTNGIISVYEDKVEISRSTITGWATQGLTGKRIIFYADLTSMEYRKPTILANGYIKFIFPGSNDKKSFASFSTKQTMDLMKDPNVLVLRAFNKYVPIEAEKIYNFIMQKIAEVKRNTIVVSNTTPSAADEIVKFKKLMDDGIISPDEYEKKKKQLLGI